MLDLALQALHPRPDGPQFGAGAIAHQTVGVEHAPDLRRQFMQRIDPFRFGQPPSETQPYFYVQNGPWIYWARPNVYPFGGQNFTRMMPVRAGSFYYEKNAWMAFRLAKGDEPL